MLVHVEIALHGEERPPVGAPIRVDVRDTSLADAPARILASVQGRVNSATDIMLDSVELEVAEVAGYLTVWAHVDVDGDGRVSRGDYVTTQSYRIQPATESRLTVHVRKV